MKNRLLIALSAVGLAACSGINSRDSDGKTPLYRAAERGDLQEARRLVEEGADIDSTNVYPLDTPTLVRWLPGGSFTAAYRPLHVAAEMGHADVVKYLLLNGAQADPRNRGEQTPLWLVAASHDDATVAELLVQYGAEVDSIDNRGVSPLIAAAQNGHASMVRFLLTKGALVGRRSHDGRNALHHAAQGGHEDVVEALLESDARPDETMNDGQTALQVAALAGYDGIVGMLLERGADPDLHAPDTTPILIAATYNGHTETVRLLLEHGATVDETSEGWSALHHAVDNDHPDIVTFLLQCGADVELRDPESNQTPLQKAVQGNHTDVARVLLEYGADPDATVPPLSPPLARAAREGYLEIVELLVLFGADVNVKDGTWTPLRLAEFGNHQAVVDFLKEQGAQY